jgi:hypothetical protein
MTRALEFNHEGDFMKRCNILNVLVVTACGFALLPGSATAQTKSLKDQLVGIWTVVSWDQTNKDGSKLQRFGASPKGVNVFDANGRFFVMFANPNLPKIASNNPMTPTPEEAKALVQGTISYYGTYTVDEASKSIKLQIESTSYPNQLGLAQERNITALTSDELKYSNPITTTGGKIDVALKRAK